jgi:hypothetical protein
MRKRHSMGCNPRGPISPRSNRRRPVTASRSPGLGPKFQQANIDKTAAQIFKDFSDLTDAGADVGGVLLGMSNKISKLVDDSMQFGTAIPENMKPLLQNLVDAGKLTDINGDKLKDLTGIKFEKTPLDSGMDKLTAALDHLADILTNTLPGAAAAAATGISDQLGKVKVPTIDLHYRYTSDNTVPDNFAAMGGTMTASGIQHFARGGRVLAFAARGGSDTVPAMLTPGETVRTARQEAALGGGAVDAINDLKRELVHVLMFRQPGIIAKHIAVANVKTGRRAG